MMNCTKRIDVKKSDSRRMQTMKWVLKKHIEFIVTRLRIYCRRDATRDIARPYRFVYFIKEYTRGGFYARRIACK